MNKAFLQKIEMKCLNADNVEGTDALCVFFMNALKVMNALKGRGAGLVVLVYRKIGNNY